MRPGCGDAFHLPGSIITTFILERYKAYIESHQMPASVAYSRSPSQLAIIRSVKDVNTAATTREHNKTRPVLRRSQPFVSISKSSPNVTQRRTAHARMQPRDLSSNPFVSLMPQSTPLSCSVSTPESLAFWTSQFEAFICHVWLLCSVQLNKGLSSRIDSPSAATPKGLVMPYKRHKRTFLGYCCRQR